MSHRSKRARISDTLASRVAGEVVLADQRPGSAESKVAPILSEESADRAVWARLVDLAGEDGFLPFDIFTEVALYEPYAGYYERTEHVPGPKGDFYTAPQVNPLFGRALARRILSVHRSLGSPKSFRIVELGSGDGALALSILTELLRKGADAVHWEYVLAERSSALRKRCSERLASLEATPGWSYRFSEGVASLGPFKGFVLANEYLDAQPHRRIVWREKSWRELGVRLEGTHASWEERPLGPGFGPPPLPTPITDPTILEISGSAEGIVREVGDNLSAGLAILIDYGYEQDELLGAHSSGTLAGVRAHRDAPNPLATPGRLDLSCFVNFTRIRAVAQGAGLREITFSRQAEALAAWGFAELLDEAVRAAGSSEEEVKIRLGAKNLLFGFENFRVLELAVGDVA